MSINYCTLAGSSIDTFCGNRRSIVLNRLINQLRPPQAAHRGGNPAHVKKIIPQIPRWDMDRLEQQTVTPTELDKVVVTVKFEGVTGVAEQNMDHRLDLVYITELKVDNAPVNVNISAIKFN